MMENQTGNAKLFQKMAQVMGKVRTIEKTGRNQFDKYDYVTSDAIATRVGTEMARVGLALFTSVVGVETSDYATKNGGSNFRSVVHMQLTFACSETGSTWTSDWYGEAIDRSDKSISKAVTSGVKYALIKTFLLAGGDEEDADSTSPTVESALGDVVFSRSDAGKTPPVAKPVLSEAQFKRLHAVGVQLYNDEWDERRPQLVQAASRGAVTSSKELTPQEAAILIAGMERKISEIAAMPVAA